MGVMTIRNVDDAIKKRLRIRAATHGRSMEEEAREILRAALLSEAVPARDLGKVIHARFQAFGGVVLPEIAREPVREPPDFAE